MKKIFMFFALFIFIGCGGSESEDFSESEDCTTIDNNMWSSPSSSHMSWSSSTHVSSTSFACIVNFNHGLVGYYDKTHGYDVRCVR